MEHNDLLNLINNLNQEIKRLSLLKLSIKQLEDLSVNFKKRPYYDNHPLITNNDIGVYAQGNSNLLTNTTLYNIISFNEVKINNVDILNNSMFIIKIPGTYYITYTITIADNNLSTGISLAYVVGLNLNYVNTTIIGKSQTITRNIILDLDKDNILSLINDSGFDLKLTYANLSIFKLK